MFTYSGDSALHCDLILSKIVLYRAIPVRCYILNVESWINVESYMKQLIGII